MQEQRKAALKKVSEELDEAEEIVSFPLGSQSAAHTCCGKVPQSHARQVAQMEVELPSMPVSIRQNYAGRLATSKQGLEKVKRTLVSPHLLHRC